MDSQPGTTAKAKHDELSREQLIQLLGEALVLNDNLAARVALLEKQLADKNPTIKIPLPFSIKAEEKRKRDRQKVLDGKSKNKKPLRSGRIKSEEKIAKATRHENVYPVGVEVALCSLSHIRPMIRIEAGQAVWIAYHVHRAPNGKYGIIQGAMGRSEFGIEIILAIAYQVYVVGLSFDKAIALEKFFQNLELKKSQVDAMLHQLSRVWEKEFESLLKLLTRSNEEYRDFADGALQIFYDGRALQINQDLSEDQRNDEIVKLADRGLALCSVRDIEQTKLDDPIADSFRLLRSELLGLMMDEQLFTFVSNPAVAPTNNEAERSLRDAATARRVGRTNKTLTGARRQTIIQSVLESIRTQLSSFTLQGVLDEVARWKMAGESCFAALLRKADAAPSEKSTLDSIYPDYKTAQDKKAARRATEKPSKSILAPATG